MLEVWAVPFSELDIDLVSYISVLTADEVERYFNFYRDSDARLYLNSHVLLKAILSQKTSLTTTRINHELYTNQYGKPFLREGPFFSISHTTGMFVMALSDRSIGIDVENYKTILFNGYDFDMVWSFAEKKYIETIKELPIKRDLFFHTWSKKESVVKALGTGLSQSFEQIVTPIRNFTLYQSERVLVQSGLQSLWFNSLALDLGEGFVGYVSGRHRLFLDKIDWINTEKKLRCLLSYLK